MEGQPLTLRLAAVSRMDQIQTYNTIESEFAWGMICVGFRGPITPLRFSIPATTRRGC